MDLNELESIRWKYTGGWRSQGTIFVRDQSGHRVPIYVGRFKRGDEWGPLLIGPAAASGATVDATARKSWNTGAGILTHGFNPAAERSRVLSTHPQ